MIILCTHQIQSVTDWAESDNSLCEITQPSHTKTITVFTQTLFRSIVSKASCLRRSRRSRLDSEAEATPPVPVLPPALFWKSMVQPFDADGQWVSLLPVKFLSKQKLNWSVSINFISKKLDITVHEPEAYIIHLLQKIGSLIPLLTI